MSHTHKKFNDIFNSNIQNINDKYMRLPLKLNASHPVSAGKKMTLGNSVSNHSVEELESMHSTTYSMVTKYQKEHLYMKRSTHLQVTQMDFKRVRGDSTSQKILPKFWKDGQLMSESNGSSGKPYIEERRVRHLKIQDFVDQLRRHKHSSSVSSSQPLPDRILKSMNSKPRDGEETRRGINDSDKALHRTKLSKENCERISCKKTSVYHTPSEYSQKKDVEAGLNIYSGVEPKFKATSMKAALSVCQRCETRQRVITQHKVQLQCEKKRISDLALENLIKDSDESVTRTLDQIRSYSSASKLHKKFSKNRHLFVTKEELHVPTPLHSKTKVILSRREKWQELMRERRERISKERILKKEMELVEQRKMEEKEKERTMQEIRERNHERIQRERKRQKGSKKREAALHAAKELYNKRLLQKYGIQNLRKYLAIEQERAELMKEYYKKRLVVKHFYEWLKYIRILNDHRRCVALSYDHKRLLKQGLNGFMKNVRDRDSDKQVAEDYYDMKLMEGSLKKWQQHAYWRQVARHSRIQQAEDFYRRQLLAKAFGTWRAHPQVAREQREKEKRKEYWRKKVREIIPDFCPI